MQIEENIRQYQKTLMNLSKKDLINYGDTDNNWGNLPCPVSYLNPLYEIYQEGMTFIDFGCGVGNVLSFANNIGYNVLGVEWNNETLKLSNKKFNYINEDITKLDSNIYNDKDVVYTYVPIKKSFKSFLNKIAKNMKVGAYLVIPEYEYKNKNFKKVSNYTYKKIK